MCPPALTPLLSLSPPPSGRDYYFNLDDTEGACDLFDVDISRMLSSQLTNGHHCENVVTSFSWKQTAFLMLQTSCVCVLNQFHCLHHSTFCCFRKTVLVFFDARKHNCTIDVLLLVESQLFCCLISLWHPFHCQHCQVRFCPG